METSSRLVVSLLTVPVALAVMVGCARPEASDGPAPAQVATVAGAGDCPTSYGSVSSGGSRHGDLVPSGSTEAVLCVYPFATQTKEGTYTLGHEVSAEPSQVGAITTWLNQLRPANATEHSCSLVGHDQYQILLRYPNQTHALVDLRYGCGIVESAGATRQIDSTGDLLAHWPTVPSVARS